MLADISEQRKNRMPKTNISIWVENNIVTMVI